MSHDIAATVAAAGITIDELAYLCGVSRTTASKWVNCRSSPHSLVRNKVEQRLVQLNAACAEKALPLPPVAGEARYVVKPALLFPDGKKRRQAAYVRVALVTLLGG